MHFSACLAVVTFFVAWRNSLMGVKWGRVMYVKVDTQQTATYYDIQWQMWRPNQDVNILDLWFHVVNSDEYPITAISLRRLGTRTFPMTIHWFHWSYLLVDASLFGVDVVNLLWVLGLWEHGRDIHMELHVIAKTPLFTHVPKAYHLTLE